MFFFLILYALHCHVGAVQKKIVQPKKTEQKTVRNIVTNALRKICILNDLHGNE